jgi:hypothetical protein
MRGKEARTDGECATLVYSTRRDRVWCADSFYATRRSFTLEEILTQCEQLGSWSNKRTELDFLPCIYIGPFELDDNEVTSMNFVLFGAPYFLAQLLIDQYL